MKAVHGLLLLGILTLLAELPLSLGQNERCLLPADWGPCTGYFPRFFYNRDSHKCKLFIYGGCEGNANNFRTLEECRSACEERCLLPAGRGPCTGYFPRFFYNRDSHKCTLFIYGGCEGNANNFETLEECRSACEEERGVCPKTPPDTGTPCVDLCRSDSECPGKQKCCRYGCMRACKDPV